MVRMKMFDFLWKILHTDVYMQSESVEQIGKCCLALLPVLGGKKSEQTVEDMGLWFVADIATACRLIIACVSS